jgi:tRNA-dihydrouridine synthase B
LVAEVRRLLLAHLDEHYALYGEYTGVRTARKHIAWYLRSLPAGEAFRQRMNSLEDSVSQQRAVADFLDHLAERHERLPDMVAHAAPLLESIA